MSQSPLIAVVDDDAGVRVSMDGLIRSLGYRVATFASAEEFLRSAEADAANCIVSDLQMPGLSGIELMQRLSAAGRRTPVILISAFLDDKVRAQASQAGAHCFLRKPFDGDDLIGCLDRALAA